MRKLILVVVLAVTVQSNPVSADDWVAPFLGGILFSNVFVPRPYVGGYGYYNYSPPPAVVYNYNSYNTYVPPPTPIYNYPAYRVQNVWDPYCVCYRSITVPNY